MTNWVQNNPVIYLAPAINGGWERWAQVDFSLRLQTLNFETILEDGPYADDTLNNDLTILPQPVLAGACCEFKTYNIYGEHLNAYRTKIADDRTKLQNNPLDAYNQGLIKWAIGIGP